MQKPKFHKINFFFVIQKKNIRRNVVQLLIKKYRTFITTVFFISVLRQNFDKI